MEKVVIVLLRIISICIFNEAAQHTCISRHVRQLWTRTFPKCKIGKLQQNRGLFLFYYKM